MKQGELGSVAHWDKARPGSSALDAAFERSMTAECAILNDEHVGGASVGFLEIV